MTGNELFEPLRGGGSTRTRRPPGLVRAVAVGLILVISGSVTAALCLHGRQDNGPDVVGTIERLPVVAQAATVQPMAALAVAAAAPAPASDQPPASLAAGAAVRISGQSVEVQNGVKIYRPIMRGGPGVSVLHVPPVSTDPAMDADAASPPSPRLPDTSPEVALLFGGLGFDRAATARAALVLPPGVTFGFTPYGEGLAAQAKMARNAGHEVVLQLPMEGVGKAESPPAHILTTDTSRTADNLAWLLTRISDYAGVSNLLGGRVLASDEALRPIVQALADRRLYFLEDGNLPRSALDGVARDAGLRTSKADVVLDARAGAVALAQDFSTLEEMARSRGSAIGTVIAGPGTAQVLAQLIARLPQKGIRLVSVGQALDSKHATAPAGLALSR